MRNLHMSEFRKALIPALKDQYLHVQGLDRQSIEEYAANVAPDGMTIVIPSIHPDAQADRFIIQVEEIFDKLLEEHSTFYEPDNDGHVHGQLKEYKLGDDFTLKVSVDDTAENNLLLHQMKRDKNVLVLPAQGTLFEKEDGEPESAQGELPIEEEPQAAEASASATA